MVLLSMATLSACSSFNALNPFKKKSEQKNSILATIQEHSASVNLQWQQNIGKPITDNYGLYTIAKDGLHIIAATQNGSLVKVNSQDGQIIWRKPIGKISLGVASNGKYIVVIDNKNKLIVLDSNGDKIWSTALDWNVKSAPFIIDNSVVLRVSGNNLVAFNLDTQKLIWQYQRIGQDMLLNSNKNSILAIDKNNILAGFHNAKLALIDAKTGLQKWEQAISYTKGYTIAERMNDIIASPVIYGQTACAATYQGKIGCLDVANGELAWEQPFSTTLNLLNDEQNIYAVDTKNNISAFNYNGQLKWQQDNLNNRNFIDGVIINNYLNYIDDKGLFHTINTKNGNIDERLQLANTNAPLIKMGKLVIFHAKNGNIYAVSVKNKE